MPEDSKGNANQVFRAMRDEGWYGVSSRTVLPVAFYLRKLKSGPEKGLSVLICDRVPSKDDFKRIVPNCPTRGVGSLATKDLSVSFADLQIVHTKDEKGEIVGLPNREIEGQAQAAHG
jgi:hypothetical protein